MTSDAAAVNSRELIYGYVFSCFRVICSLLHKDADK